MLRRSPIPHGNVININIDVSKARALCNRFRAYDNHVYMKACNGVEPDTGGNYYFGHSMIVDPIAHKLARGYARNRILS